MRVPLRFGASLLVAYLLAITNTFSRGAYSDHALQFVVIAGVLLIWRFIVAIRDREPALGAGDQVVPLAWAGLFGMAWNAWNDPAIVIYAQKDWVTGRQAEVASLLLLITYLPSVVGRSEPRALRDARFAVFAALLLAAGVATLRVSPTPSIDVWTVQQHGAEALLHGKNPFTAVAEHDTAPGVARDNVPYVYPPTQALITAPFFYATGDVRFAMLFALLVSGVAMRSMVRRSPLKLPAIVEDAPALFLWLSPKLFFILEQAWVDPVQLALISVALAAEAHRRRWASVVLFGVVFSAKQTMFWIAPLAGLGFRWSLRQWAAAIATAVLLPLPFLVWDFKALKYANFDFLTGLPSRDDALTLTNWGQRKFGEPVSGRYGFVSAALVVALSAWRLRGSIAKFGVAVVTAYFFFFTLNKWAFANYYFILGGLAALAAAASFHDPSIEGEASELRRASSPPA